MGFQAPAVAAGVVRPDVPDRDRVLLPQPRRPGLRHDVLLGTRALGPWFGWIGGWAVCTTGILIIGSLADVGARYSYLLFGWDSAAESKAAVMGLAVAIIIVMTAICVHRHRALGRVCRT